MLGEIFQILDLTSKDEQLYMAALKLGPQPASIIARKADVKRVDAYNHLACLCNRGIFRMETRNGIKHFAPCSPDKILRMLKIKRSIIVEAENKLKMLIPVLS
ncbi:hypothetical protein COW94_04120 [Candidatus Peregrinibacteria bacterium CG22_combo_CG10-13_8_21_14_all_44_10]|nr:MAG: hypothetical protein AUK45_02760 [Candidatus Peregrinibacteria bacterium CG2_30_44_17]PIP66004.1 MAG: hypothetical protein COW94_04120 [Candidatus Peregrinibacteria bacterium CG22_combo_CG10-13_8_21_14_all_44_10]PIX79859.1 MAG: hypothetical protein COZ35_02455 [Candidatus Peregrinibacteria bacterium CG_4_10_14_3_um_filter_44_21]PJB89326.1 MAG: hypothetical protein CO082_01550 [Candidatus Peregrinibacteria bacterium CG_4_9_14_0_8_um_filter_44_15]